MRVWRLRYWDNDDGPQVFWAKTKAEAVRTRKALDPTRIAVKPVIEDVSIPTDPVLMVGWLNQNCANH